MPALFIASVSWWKPVLSKRSGLILRLQERTLDSKKKILGMTTLQRALASYRRKRKKVVFTNGCFDLLHFGHVRYLEAARKKGDILIVGVNSDASVRELKGSTRPVNPQSHRMAVLAALQCVDHVVMFAEETPLRLILKVKPDVLVKGADWKGKEVVGGDVVKKNGGKVALIRYVPGCSTTNLIRKIQRHG